MKGYFRFTRKQRIGVTSLAFLIVILVVALNVNQHRELEDISGVELAEAEFSSNVISPRQDEDIQKKNSQQVKLQPFNPNDLELQAWMDIGFSEKQAQVILNYHKKNGPFYTAEDLAPIYVISDEKLKELEPFMIFDSTLEAIDEKETSTLIDVNLATQEELESIYGIGPTFAKRTVNYRNSLGGYVDKAQFENIYGITPEALQALKEHTTINLNEITLLNINTATKDEIKRHPYLKEWEVVTAILSERDKKSLKDLNFLVDNGLKTQAELDLIIPYIQFNE